MRNALDFSRMADMDYLKRPHTLRLDASRMLDHARSVVCLALPYRAAEPSSIPPDDNQSCGRISSYAWGKDYHGILSSRLRKIEAFIQDLNLSERVHTRSCVDSTPLMERAYATRAGVGFPGKNTTIISPGYGSWIVLGEIITTLALEPDSPVEERCGTCGLCLVTCPTGALRAPYILDARLCIAYHTIENRKGIIPDGVKEKMSTRLFGCDSCQSVCPLNKEAVRPAESPLTMRTDIHNRWLNLAKVLSIRSDEEFRRTFHDSPLARPGRIGLMRNAAIVAGNLGSHALRPLLEKLRSSDDYQEPALRDAIDYALARM